MKTLSWLSALIIYASTICMANPTDEQPEKYQFFIDGKAIELPIISVDGKAGSPVPTDLLVVDRHVLVLGDNKKQQFYFQKEESNVLWIEVDGKRRPAAARITWTFSDDEDEKGRPKRIVNNPLAKMAKEDISGLRGIMLDYWSDDLEKLLNGISGEKVCFQLAGDAVQGLTRKLPNLPDRTQYLFVRENSNQGGIQDYSTLNRLTHLRYLNISSMTSGFDCSHLRKASNLKHLILSVDPVQNSAVLAANSKLQVLSLNHSDGVNDVGFVRDLNELQHLRIIGTKVTDLTPLNGHPSLTTVLADNSELKKLPLHKTLPKLTRLEALSTKVSAKDAEAFEKLNPQCRLSINWTRALQIEVGNADRMRVRSGGTCHRDIAKEKTLFEEKNVEKIKAFVKQISINESKSNFHCMCCGDPSIEFYQGNKLLATLGYHHGQSMRWPGGWPSDGALTVESAKLINLWLREHIPEIRKAQDLQLAQQKNELEAFDRFISCFPEKAKSYIKQGNFESLSDAGYKRVAKTLLSHCENEKDFIVSACKAFASQEGWNSSWSSTGGKERLILATAKETKSESYMQALATMKDDRTGLLGAARLFFFEDFDKRLPQDMQITWLLILAEVSLTDGWDGNKSMVLRALGRHKESEVKSFLFQVMQGKVGKEMKEADSQEPGLRTSAALLLAKLGSEGLKDEISKMVADTKTPSDTAALEVALAILGDPAQLKPAHFKLQSYTIGYGALHAIEKFDGAYGLDILCLHGIHHPWGAVNDDAEKLARKITKQNWPDTYKGMLEIEKWWKEKGAAFVEQRRKEKKLP